MALKDLYKSVLAVLLLATITIAQDDSKSAAATDEEDGRLFFGTTGTTGGSTLTLGTLDTQTITVGLDAALIIGLALAGLTGAVIVLAILLGIESDKKYEDTGYAAPTSYATGPVYEDSSYAIQRSLEDAAKKFE